MEIINKRPPNWEKVREAFPFDERFTVFAYGDKIYNPGKGEVSDDTIVHEKVHAMQQGFVEGEPLSESLVKIWWDMYIGDVDFRLSQEIQAHQVQYDFLYKRYKNPDIRQKILVALARNLISPVYGGKMTLEEAKKVIAEGVDNSA